MTLAPDLCTAAELEFLAENEEVYINPTFSFSSRHANSEGKITLIMGNYGPFKAGTPIKVPLWMAMRLKEDNACNIKPPAWMEADALAQSLREEKLAVEFTDLPFYYQQIATVLLTGAAEDIPDRARVAELLDDLERARQVKLANTIKTALEGAATMTEPQEYVLKNASAGEVNMLRNGFFSAIDHIVEMRREQSSKDTRTLESEAAARAASRQAVLRPRLERRSRPAPNVGASTSSSSSSSSAAAAASAAGREPAYLGESEAAGLADEFRDSGTAAAAAAGDSELLVPSSAGTLVADDSEEGQGQGNALRRFR